MVGLCVLGGMWGGEGGHGGESVVLVIPGSHHLTVGFSLSRVITYYREATPLGADIL